MFEANSYRIRTLEMKGILDNHLIQVIVFWMREESKESDRVGDQAGTGLQNV